MENGDVVLRVFACISFVLAAVECFAGYKILKTLIAIWSGFVGVAIGVKVGVVTNSALLAVFLLLVFGITLVFLALKFYMAGVFIQNAILAGLAMHLVIANVYLSILFGVILGMLSLLFLKPAVIFNTAFSGGGILVASAYLMLNVEITANSVVTAILWVPIALTGIVIQCVTTRPMSKGSEIRSRQGSPIVPNSTTERRYPGMQRAYRNYCIRCGAKLETKSKHCAQCGYEF